VNQKFLALEKELKCLYFEREEIIRGMLVALIARGNLLMLGPPGTAKTDLAQRLCSQLGGNFFARLLTKVSAPEELFGPLSLKALETDVYRRVTTKKLPEADVAVIDEVFKCNSAVLNTLLPIMNERVYFDDSSQGIPIPLLLLVGLSNELPDGGTEGELSALWDRFDLRYVVGYLRDERSFSSMISLNGSKVRTQISLAEVKQAQQKAASVKINPPVIQAMVKLWKELKQNGFIISDRRFRNSQRFLKAHAWLEGRVEVAEDDFEVLTNMFWTEPEQMKTIKKIALGFANPLLVKANEIFDGVIELYQKLKEMPDGNEKSQAATEANHKLKTAAKLLENLAAQAYMEGKSTSAINAKAKQVKEINKEVVDKYLLGL
jgi:MoxR-like ATPase